MRIAATMTTTTPAVLLRRATYASVAAALLLILIKIAAWLLTDSVALLSSLVDSILDIFASIINLVAVRHALAPADAEHRFGHGKAEPLAGLSQAAFIAGSALFIFMEALQRLWQPVPVHQGMIGIVVMVVSLVITLCLVAYQRHVSRLTGSLAVRADSLHYASDVALNLSVIIALLLTVHLGWVYADPLFAIAIAVYIMHSVWHIARQSLDQLMDRELPDEERDRIISIVMQHPAVRNVHDLRTRASGHDKFIQIHLEVDGQLKLYEAHAVAVEVQKKIETAFPEADVIIHEDPV
jgi:ferrous-iron efflux pump FieF